MARGNYTQSSFLGGEFSPSAGGRIDLPQYRAALARCTNAYPIEEGAVTRRPGTRFIQPTRFGDAGAILPFNIAQDTSYLLEYTHHSDNTTWIRSYREGHLVADGNAVTVTAVSTATPTQITLASARTWNTGDIIMLQVNPSALDATEVTMWSKLVNRQFSITKVDTTHFTLQDMLTGGNIGGTPFTGTLPLIVADRITAVSGTYNGGISELLELRPTQAESSLILCSGNLGTDIQPTVINVATPQTGTTDATFSSSPLFFQDGPYNDPNTVDAATVSATTGVVTFTLSTHTEVNGGAGFKSTDVGRLIRIQVVPPYWVSGTTYANGSLVSFPPNSQAIQYTAVPSSIATNVGLQPNLFPGSWVPVADQAQWQWGIISAFTDANHVSLTLQGPITNASWPIPQWQLGFYNNTDPTWPISAGFIETRLAFGSAANRIDLSTTAAEGGFNNATQVDMSPTDPFGTVLDGSGISYTFDGPDNNIIYWMHPDGSSLICGTSGSEWVVQATQLGEPLTPTSFQAHQYTRVGSPYLQPIRPGIALVFVNRYTQRVMEYLVDPFTQKYSAKPLNIYAQHLGSVGKLAYQDAPNPMIWTLNNNFVSGCLYRRVSYFASEMPAIYAWHSHALDSGQFVVTDLANIFIQDGALDALHLLITDGNFNYVTFLGAPFSDTAPLTAAQFVDNGMSGIIYGDIPNRFEGLYAVDDGGSNFYFNGLFYLAGKTVSVFFGGLDFGDYVVAANGSIGPIPYASDPGAFGTQAYLKSVGTPGGTGSEGQIPIKFQSGGVYFIPGIVGEAFTTILQRLRPDPQQDTHTQFGSGAGQLKHHWYYALNVTAGVANTVTISGGAADQAFPVTMANYKTGQPTPTNVLFTGIARDTINSDEDLDGQIIIRLSRPVPLTIAAITGFLEVEEM